MASSKQQSFLSRDLMGLRFMQRAANKRRETKKDSSYTKEHQERLEKEFPEAHEFFTKNLTRLEQLLKDTKIDNEGENSKLPETVFPRFSFGGANKEIEALSQFESVDLNRVKEWEPSDDPEGAGSDDWRVHEEDVDQHCRVNVVPENEYDPTKPLFIRPSESAKRLSAENNLEKNKRAKLAAPKDDEPSPYLPRSLRNVYKESRRKKKSFNAKSNKNGWRRK